MFKLCIALGPTEVLNIFCNIVLKMLQLWLSSLDGGATHVVP